MISVESTLLHHLGRVHKYKSPFCCMICWKDEEISVGGCILSATDKNPSNLKSHFQKRHLELYKSMSKKKNIPDCSSALSQHAVVLKKHSIPSSTFAAEHANGLMYKFFNSCNVAIQNSSNDYLRRYTDYIIEHSTAFKSTK